MVVLRLAASRFYLQLKGLGCEGSGRVRSRATGTDPCSRFGAVAPIEASVRLSASCGYGLPPLAPVGGRYVKGYQMSAAAG